MKNALQTGVDLKKRGIVIPNCNFRCSFCGQEEETKDHIFFSCIAVYDVWMRCYSWFGIVSVWLESTQQIFCQRVMVSGSALANRIWRILWCSITWVIWNWRNNAVFRGTALNFHKLWHDALFHYWSWLKSYEPNFNYSYVQWETNPGPCIDQ